MTERVIRTAAGASGDRGRPLGRGVTELLEESPSGVVVRRTLLPSGLRVITEHIPGARSAAVGLWVQVGSRDEAPEVAGAAHYLEHLLFKGTARRTAAAIAEEIDAVGGELNAFTAKEHTCYYAHVLDSDLPLAVDLVCDVVFDALCEQRDFETERGVVLEEIAMRDDDPEDLLHDAFLEALMGGHELGRSVLGSEQSITDMDRDALYAFYRGRYSLPSMVLSAAGNVDHERVLELARERVGERLLDVPGTPVPPRGGEVRVDPVDRLVLHSDDTEQAHLMLGVRALDRHDERRFALNVLNAALGGGMSSRLFQEVRERRGLAYQVYSSVGSYADTGTWSVYAGCQPDRLGDVAGVIRDVLAEVVANGLTDAEIARAKGQLRGAMVLGLEDTGSRMSRVGKGELNYGDYLSVEQTLERVDAVTSAEVAELAAELLRRPVAAAVVGPYDSIEDLPHQVHEVIS
ncbi:insulinase family protein [Actinosynnema pretiosum subsp. pretiosum]|uniref:Peptidase M16 domain protein n=3 Tax=Actinosynnema TaxID=40566 RepID=C6WDJ6_ACTMD|nr:peptidase M16 domain protein [Actinosynnema mirum DSM 43827]ATE56752.1 insulinase family protein [Actinosynnema pretiosum]AXX33141.1 peptidase, M16 family [Actinosynnema pretiosum subsp. pretiosum]QUF03016.1 insulinase family protein [Actinosynnema pretiosum subsp. pretiosum]